MLRPSPLLRAVRGTAALGLALGLLAGCSLTLESIVRRESPDVATARDATAPDVTVSDVPTVMSDALDAAPSADVPSRADRVVVLDVLVLEGSAGDAHPSTDVSLADIPTTSSCDAGSPPPYPCNASASDLCPDITAALVLAHAAALRVPCCSDDDCSALVSADLCCAGQDAVPPSPAASCVQALTEAAARLTRCPAVCTDIACRMGVARCVRGVCMNGG